MTFDIDDRPAAAPHRPPVRAGVARQFNSYATDTPLGRVVVQAWPHRRLAEARQLARRIHRDPAGYLWAARAFALSGIATGAAGTPRACVRPVSPPSPRRRRASGRRPA